MGASSKYLSGSAAERNASAARILVLPHERSITRLLMSNPTGRGEAWHWCRRRPGRVAAGRQGAGRGGLPAGQERAELGDGAHQRAAENGDVNVHHMSSARLAVKTISGIPPSARDTGHTRLASSACAASYRHPCLLCPPGQTLTIQTTAGTHGAGPVTGNPVQFDCAPEAGGGVSATSLHLPWTAAAWQARNIVRD